MRIHGKSIFHYLFSLAKKVEWKQLSPSKEILNHLAKSSAIPIQELLQQLQTTEQGLNEEEASDRQKIYGPNTVVTEKPPTWYGTLFKNFVNPFVLLLLCLSIFSFLLGNFNAVVIIISMVFLSILMRFTQEYRSNKSAEKLKAMVSNKTSVYRASNTPKEVPFRTLVPGDIIALSAGDMLPGDVRLISSHDLYVSQSSLTGEAFPLEKHASAPVTNASGSHALEIPNLCLMGTTVVSGIGKAVIISTGQKTYFGSIARAIVAHRPLTSFDIGVNKVSWLLIRIMLFMVPVVFLINGLDKGDWIQALLFALSVAVGLTPEMLPMLITTNLAKGAINMARDKVIVKQLNSIQNFGAIDVLCTDKTGTLTEDKIILELHLDLNGEDDKDVLDYGFLNSYFQTGLKNLMDVAILEHTELEQLLKTYRKIDEIPFDFSRKRMSIVVGYNTDDHLLICKGSFGTISPICTQAKIGGTITPLNGEVMEKVNHLHNQLNNQGFRVLAVATKDLPAQLEHAYHIKDESSMTLIGLLAFLDPPKQTAAAAIKELQSSGITVKILTGDNEVITNKICQSVDLDVLGIITGPEIETMKPEVLGTAVEKNTIFAKLTPLHKALIINHLKKNGHVVGYLGDGINDALALREADLGISVDMAADIAKESSDIIMLEKSLLFLNKGVIEGRKTFGNIIKYIKMAISSNFGNVFSILGASLLLPFLPMLPVQLLLQNFLYDISQLAIPFDKVDKEFLMKPHKWNPKGISRFMFFIGPISSIFDYVTFGILWFVFLANAPERQAFFQTGWFIEGLLSQVLIVHMIRTQKIPFFQSIASFPLLVTTVAIMILGVIIPYSSIGHHIGMTSLPFSYFLWLIPVILMYCTLTQLVKVWYIKKFHGWL